MTRLRSILVGGNVVAGMVYAFVSVTAPTVRIPQETINLRKFTLTKAAGEYELDPDVRLLVDGSMLLEGGTFRMGNAEVRVTGNFTLRCNASFEPSNAPLVLGGRNAVIGVEKCPRTVIDPAIYSGATLVTETGSHIEWFTPSLGNVQIAP